jgi:DnaJ-class molecular chaperone
MDRTKDYYSILGVGRDATPAAIKRAYRRLAKRYHPDVGRGSSVEEFEALQAAYETLTDAERRRRYDEELRRNERQRDRFEPLAWSFVRSPAAGDLRRPLLPGSLSGEILLTQFEAAQGGVLPLDVPLTAACPSCDGTGGFVFDCGRCGGDGQVERRLPVPLRIPAGVRDGTVFQVRIDEPAELDLLLTVHVRAR